MNTENILKPLTKDQLSSLSRRDLTDFALGEQDFRIQLEKAIDALNIEVFELGDKYIRIKNLLFSPRSEKSGKKSKSRNTDNDKEKNKPGTRDKKKLKPSERYPNAEVQEKEVELIPSPTCSCGEVMEKSGLYEESEMLTVIPKKYLISRQFLAKYRCRCCHGALVTTPNPPRIKPGSAYSDAMIIDVALSKYCDLIPIERYSMMAARQGIVGLPQNSLIELTHYLASFLQPVVELIKMEVLSSLILYADETPHRMLENLKKHWYLWGFSSSTACYFQIEKSRSGDVASKFLLESLCEYLVSDVYSGYGKAVRMANEQRAAKGVSPIRNAYCNAHARRRFREINGDEGQYFLERYREVYQIEAEAKTQGIEARQEARNSMKPIFSEMKVEAEKLLTAYSEKSSQVRAANYFIGNFEGLTHCLSDIRIDLDNNRQESLFRNPVIGRKTWYGNHSHQGAQTTAAMHTITESCKLNKENPREYFPWVVKTIHEKKNILTPSQYRNMRSSVDPPDKL